MLIESFAKQIAQDLELESIPTLDENKMILLPIHPELLVSLKELDPGVYLLCRIALCPNEKKEDLFISLMRANFLGQGTGGGVIALDLEEKYLTLSSAIPYDMNYKAFKTALEDFVNYVDYWREEIARYQKNIELGLFS